MYGQVHLNLVSYSKGSEKPIYRQIAVVELDTFQVKIFSGETVQTDPKFIARCSEAEVYFHETLREAIKDAEGEFQQTLATGEWEAIGI